MKKLSKSIDRYLQPVKLYIDDVEDLIEIMEEAYGKPTLNLKTDEYELADFSELKDIRTKEGRESISRLDILMVEEPRISISIDHEVHVSASSDTSSARGVVDKVQEIMRARKRWLAFSMFAETNWITGLLILTPFFVGMVFVALSPATHDRPSF